MNATDVPVGAITRAETIARLNDRCRFGLDRTARTLITRGCLATFASGSTAEGLLAAVRAYRFNGLDGELRDSGCVRFRGTDVFFRIDAYDLTLTFGSPDPASRRRSAALRSAHRVTGADPRERADHQLDAH